jgi:synaptic vesicle membrane protein VAT-1
LTARLYGKPLTSQATDLLTVAAPAPITHDPCMRRILIHEPGGYDALQLDSAPDPVPGPGAVLIDVAACGVNFADGIIRMGLYASAKALHGYPITPGFEVAGRVSAVGDGVVSLSPGDAVVALTLFGGYCDRIVLPETNVFRCPAGVDLIAAAGLPTVFLTAWFMVHRQVNPRPGECWLVHSAAGGVGSALIQLGVLAGCRVVAVVGRPDKRDHCLAMGANAVIDKSTEALWPAAESLAPNGYDAIFDANGVSTLRESYRHLAPAGRLAIYGFHGMLPRNGRLNWLKLAWHWWRTPRFDPLDMTQQNRSVLAANLSFLQSHAGELREGMLWLLERFADGRLAPLPIETFALEHAADAQRRLESGRTLGKLVLLT